MKTMNHPLALKTLIGDYPNTKALKSCEIRSANVAFDFADVKVPNTAFKDVVRHLKYDVAELAIVTFLQAKAHGKPLVLLPAVVVGAMPHPYLVYNAVHGRITPADLKGKRVGGDVSRILFTLPSIAKVNDQRNSCNCPWWNRS